MNEKLTPYQIDVPDTVLDDLKQRLNNMRLPPPINGAGWPEGTDQGYLSDLLRYWSSGYNWREREAWLNSFDHYLADIDGTKLHFIRAASESPNAIPLLLMQGWPSSFIQVLDILPMLTDYFNNSDVSFDVIAVSMPGYAFSDIPSVPGMSFSKIADLVVKLMVDVLGYQRFAARGSDQGALVQQQIGLKYPEKLIGLHRSGITPFLNPLPADLTEEEIVYQKQVQAWAQRETAYANLQALRPETILPALADSPAGLASWILEKFQRWGDCGHDLNGYFGKDKLLDNIMLHWLAFGGAGAVRLYHGSVIDPGLRGRIEIPTAIAMPLHDGITVPAPKSWAERFYNVQQWTVFDKGGHFPEWEVPEQLADDVKRFFRNFIRHIDYPL